MNRRSFIKITNIGILASKFSIMQFGLCEFCGAHPKMNHSSAIRMDIPGVPMMHQWSCIIDNRLYNAAILMYDDFNAKFFVMARRQCCFAFQNRIKVLRGEAKESDFTVGMTPQV